MLADQLETWSGCYDESWGEFITPESFCHPAKMSYGLVEKIVKHGFERGYWKVNDLIGDPFSGVGCVGIMAAAHGLRYIGCELEPKFHALSELNLQLNPWCRNGVCRAVCGDSRNFASLIGQCDTVVTSAPFAGSDNRGGTKMPDGYFDVTGGIRTSDDLVPQSPGQLASLPVGDLSSVICSPPYAESITGSHGERESAEDSRDARRTDGGSLGQSQRHGGYGITEGQIGAMPVGNCDAICTSPPWETSEPQQDKSFRAPHDSTLNLAKSDYGSTNGQLGKTSGPTYWGAVKTIYEQCLLALKPGGVICVVMGNFVRAGEIVDLCGDTWTLLQHVGFTPLERIKALKTTTTEHAGLFEPIKKTKSKVSFFRRLSINRGSPDPGGEQVLFLRKPGL